MLCDNCKQREATIFICHGGKVAASKNLCETCHLELASPLEAVSFKKFTDAFLNGKCEYCGGARRGGWWRRGFDARNESAFYFLVQTVRGGFEGILARGE